VKLRNFKFQISNLKYQRNRETSLTNDSWKEALARAPRLVAVAAALGWMATTPNFFTARTFGSVVELAGVIGVLAMGQAFVLIGGGFDLSQGANLALTAAATAWLAVRGVHPAMAVVAAVAIGTLLGAVNGLFVAGVGTNPFVTTLSTMLIDRGAAYLLLGGGRISGVAAFDRLNAAIPLGRSAAFPLRSLVFPVVAALAWVALRQTVFGQHVYAVGGNAEAARLAGVRSRRIRAATFALSGAAAGLASVLLLAWIRVAKPDTASGYELDSIAACVVGGVSLQGGTGSAPGAALGCLLLEALRTLITMSGLPDEYRTLITGAVILTFAWADALARRAERR
jgi:ribose transport system permease protein